MNAASVRSERAHFRPQLVTARWSAGRDVNWGAIDAPLARSQPVVLNALRDVAVDSSARVVVLSELIRAMWADTHASAVLVSELSTSLKHFHVLRTYLEAVEHEPAITDSEVVSRRRALMAVEPGRIAAVDRLAELLAHRRAASQEYEDLSRCVVEPVLSSMLLLLAADERRSAAALTELLRAPRLVLE